MKHFKLAFSFSYQSLQQMTDELERKCKVLQLRYEEEDEHSSSLRSPKEEASTSDSEFECKQHKQIPRQVLAKKLKESKGLLKRVRDMQKKTKPFFDGLEQLSTVTKEEWLMLEKLMRLGEEVIKMGELLQLDGSIHAWLPGSEHKQCLMNLVDDATGKSLALMDEGETTRAAFISNHSSTIQSI